MTNAYCLLPIALYGKSWKLTLLKHLINENLFTSIYVSLRQCASYIYIKLDTSTSIYVNLCQFTSIYVSLRQFTSVYVKYLVPSAWYQVLGAKYQVLGTKYLVPDTWYQVLGTKYLVNMT